MIGATGGLYPGTKQHLSEVIRARREWANLTPTSMKVPDEWFKTYKHEATRLNLPKMTRRALTGSAVGFATGALTGALIDYIRRRRKEDR